MNKKWKFIIGLIVLCSSCAKSGTSVMQSVTGVYAGTATVTIGLATTTTENLYSNGIRVAGLGSIKATDSSVWTVPSEVNFTNANFPTASDLYNPNGNKYNTAAAALAAFNPSKIIQIDSAGEIITGYIFADNYFELYINGIPVGKDAIPFTDFNSHIVKFKVSKPYTIAMKLVDWEERLGLGCETNNSNDYHPGDGGMVAVFKDAAGKTICKSGADWKAQTFYIAPIKDYGCVSESGTSRISSNCNTADVMNGAGYAALHWKIPATWMNKTFDDSSWPNATIYSNTAIGVDNKSSYTNFTDIFDESNNDAQFIWSTNVILDNEVIVRKIVQ